MSAATIAVIATLAGSGVSTPPLKMSDVCHFEVPVNIYADGTVAQTTFGTKTCGRNITGGARRRGLPAGVTE